MTLNLDNEQPTADDEVENGAGLLDKTSRALKSSQQVVQEVSTHPTMCSSALDPGIGVERMGYHFSTNPVVFLVTGLLIVSVIVWAVLAPNSIDTIGDLSLAWVISHFSWLFTVIAVTALLYMLILGYGRFGQIRLGEDGEQPQFSTFSWITMLFSAGMGIGLLFYGPYEPLAFFTDPPHGFATPGGSVDAAQKALAQTVLHWGLIPWTFYALVGGAIAYSSYRRGRPALISALFEPLFGAYTRGLLGAIIDIFAIIVTLFGTTISLGIGALQVTYGTGVVTGIDSLGSLFILGTVAVLTAIFILSAISGVDRGVRILSNINMVVAAGLAIFVFIAGPTLFLLNLLPASAMSFVTEFGTMLSRNPNQGADTTEFLSNWTTYYWAWWISWSPFVGTFIAKISRGRTLREYVTVVIIMPTVVCFLWFLIMGGTSVFATLHGSGNLNPSGEAEAMLFDLFDLLPFSTLTTILAMLSIVVFFVTSANSASIVMSSMSQRGNPDPMRKVTTVWGLLLGVTAAALLFAGGEHALNSLQSIMMITALPFILILIGIMVAWVRELHNDPYMQRYRGGMAALDRGVRHGFAAYGDEFTFSSNAMNFHYSYSNEKHVSSTSS